MTDKGAYPNSTPRKSHDWTEQASGGVFYCNNCGVWTSNRDGDLMTPEQRNRFVRCPVDPALLEELELELRLLDRAEAGHV